MRCQRSNRAWRLGYVLGVLSPAAAVLLLAGPALADWPNAGHDPQRTSVSPATSDITNPAVYWKAYVGGSLDSDWLPVGRRGRRRIPRPRLRVGRRGRRQATVGARHLADATPRHPVDLRHRRLRRRRQGRHPRRRHATRRSCWRAKTAPSSGAKTTRTSGRSARSASPTSTATSAPTSSPRSATAAAITQRSVGLRVLVRAHGQHRRGNQAVEPAAVGGDLYSCGVPTVLFDGDGDGTASWRTSGRAACGSSGATARCWSTTSTRPLSGNELWTATASRPTSTATRRRARVLPDGRSAPPHPTPRQVFVLHYDATTSPASLSSLWQNTTLADAVGGDLDFEPDAVVDLDGNGIEGGRRLGHDERRRVDHLHLRRQDRARRWRTHSERAHGRHRARCAPTASSTSSRPTVRTSPGGSTTRPVNPVVQSTWTLAGPANHHARRSGARFRTVRANQRARCPDLDHDGRRRPADAHRLARLRPLRLLRDAGDGSAGRRPSPSRPTSTRSAPGSSRRSRATRGRSSRRSRTTGCSASSTTSLHPADVQLRSAASAPAGIEQVARASRRSAASTERQSLFVTDSRGRAASLRRAEREPRRIRPAAVVAYATATRRASCRRLDGAARPSCAAVRSNRSPYPPLPALVGGAGRRLARLERAADRAGTVYDALPGHADASGAPAVLVQTVDQECRHVTTLASRGRHRRRRVVERAGRAAWGVLPVLRGRLERRRRHRRRLGDELAAGALRRDGSVARRRAPTSSHTASRSSATSNDDGVIDATLQGGYYPARTLQHDLTTATWVGGDTKPVPDGRHRRRARAAPSSWRAPRSTRRASTSRRSPGASMGASTLCGVRRRQAIRRRGGGDRSGSLPRAAQRSVHRHEHHRDGEADGRRRFERRLGLRASTRAAARSQFALPLERVGVRRRLRRHGRGRARRDPRQHERRLHLRHPEPGGRRLRPRARHRSRRTAIADKQVDQIVTESTLFGAWQAVGGRVELRGRRRARSRGRSSATRRGRTSATSRPPR